MAAWNWKAQMKVCHIVYVISSSLMFVFSFPIKSIQIEFVCQSSKVLILNYLSWKLRWPLIDCPIGDVIWSIFLKTRFSVNDDFKVWFPWRPSRLKYYYMYFGIVRPIGVEIKHARRDIFILLIFSLQKLCSRFHYETLDRQDQAQVN